MSRQIADAVFAQVKSGFIWTSDKDQYEVSDDWRTHTDAVRAGEVWRDDCDGFAATAMELAAEQGARAALVFCYTEANEAHLVCAVLDDEDAWIIDNRQRSVKSWSDIPYRWRTMCETGKWRTIKGVS